MHENIAWFSLGWRNFQQNPTSGPPPHQFQLVAYIGTLNLLFFSLPTNPHHF